MIMKRVSSTFNLLQLTADVTLEEEVNRNWQEIIGREYVFNRAETQASILSDVG